MTRSALRSPRRRAAALLAALLLAAPATAGCSSFAASGDKGYVSGDGSIITLDPADRDAPVDLQGTDQIGRAHV